MDVPRDRDHHRTVILNSLDDHFLAVDRRGEKRVVNEMDFFADKNFSEDASEVFKKETKFYTVQEELNLNISTGLNLSTNNTIPNDKSTVEDNASVPQGLPDDVSMIQFLGLKSELHRVNAENEHLRDRLNQINSKYCSLQMQIAALLQGASTKGQKSIDGMAGGEKQRFLVPRQFMDDKDRGLLSAFKYKNSDGETYPHFIKKEKSIADELNKTSHLNAGNEKSFQEWIPNKVPKFNSSKDLDQDAAEATMKKARVSLRARSEASMISDGCQWRKYGQKMAKGNPCPRAYYRCSMAVGCPVRKQIQRCAEDRAVVITTYEGNHNHPLPPAAMAMASTTSAAASVLLSGPMTSTDGFMNPNLLTRSPIHPYSASLASISSSTPFPTVTLDLTNNPVNQIPQPGHLARDLASEAQAIAHAFNNHSRFLTRPSSAASESSHEMMNAATAAITSDPNFTAALTEALSSIIGSLNPSIGIDRKDHSPKNSSERNMGINVNFPGK